MNLRKQLSSYIALNNYVEAIRSSQLPTGYTELESIESTGTQYIDTGIVNWNNTLEYEIKLSIEPQSGTKTYFGCYDGWSTSKNNVPSISTWTNYKVASNFRAGYSSSSGTDIGISNGQTGTISFKGNTISWSEGSSTSFDRGYDFTVSSSIFLFALHTNIGATEFATTKIYRAKFWLNGELIRDFRPMLDYNNVACMFDMVTGKCFYNQGTDTFITGPEVYKSSIVLTDAITNGLTDLQLKGSEVKNKPETFLDSVVAKGGTEQNGTPTPDTPMDIVCNNGVLKVSPNLFDKNASYALFDGYINNVSVGQNTTLMPCSGGDKTIIIKVAPNTTYTVTRVTNLGSVYDRIRCAAFTALPVSNSTGVILCNYMNTQQANATFTTLSDTQYVAINVRNSGAVGDDWTQFVDAFQLEQGSTATQYRPYGQIYADGTAETIKDSLNNTATAEMLLKVGDYQDVQEILSGDVTRKIGVKVLNGTEDWVKGQSFYCNALAGVLQADHSCYCTHYQGIMNNSAVVTDSNTCRVGYHIGSAIAWDRLYIYADRSLYATAADFANYLAQQYAAGTPVIVIYPLNASTTETVSPQKLFKNPVTVTEASINDLEVTTTEAEHTVPTPDYPLDIVCNNGVLKVGPNNDVIVEGTPETVTITGKNLYDVTKDTTGKYIGKDGSIGNDSYSCYSGLIPVKEGESYTYSGVCNMGATTANNKRIHGYVNGIWNQQITVIVINENTPFYTTFTIPTGINGIRISHWYKDENTQVEEGIRPTKYEEYYQASFTPEDLLKLSDYQDVQNVLDGIVTKNVGIKVLDGTEDWTRYGTGKFAMPLIGSKKQDQQEAPFATHFVGTSYNNVPAKDGYVSVFNGSIAPTSGVLGVNYQATPEVEQFKQWLADQYAAGTPVIVVYPLANTVEETVESRDVFITSGTNTIERNSEYVSSDGMTVKYKKLR